MIGIDLIKIERMGKMMERFGQRALERFLSAEEILLIKNPKNAAGFWAAKEACSKALGLGIGKECSFFDITLSKSSRGAPSITLSQRINEQFRIEDISLSITHDGEYAIAVVAIQSSSTYKVK